MRIDKKFKGLERLENGDYFLKGEIRTDEDLIVELDDRLKVEQGVYAKRIEINTTLIAGGGIEAVYGIDAGEEIEAGDGIKAGFGIEAGGGIEAGLGIDAGYGIKAGWGIKAGDGIKAGWGIEAGDGIKAGDGIDAGEEIEAGGRIIAGDGIKAGWGIKADCGIEAHTFISSQKRIFAGISIYKNSSDCDKTIKCAELRSGEIAYGDLIITKSKEEPIEEMTLKEVCEKLGKNIKIIKWSI